MMLNNQFASNIHDGSNAQHASWFSYMYLYLLHLDIDWQIL